MEHEPVLLDAVLSYLTENGPPERLIDGTVGAGGHSRKLLEAGTGAVLGLDQDASALAAARETLKDYMGRVHLVHLNYEYMRDAAAILDWDKVDAVLLDIGVSSMQLDRAERGFSFMQDGPLDMRMNPDMGQPAYTLVNTWDEQALANIFRRYGEERYSRQLAKAVVANRPYETTTDLVRVIDAHKPQQWKERIHPATRVFQALRIAVNDELGVLERTLPAAIHLLRPGGRLAVISFHSLEDRIVKQVFKYAASDCVCPPEQPVCTCDKEPTVKILTRKPVTADPSEVKLNPRSRSAKLRVVEKV